MQKRLFWKALQKGDLIDIVAPAWACKSSEIQKGIAFLKQEGFAVRLQKNILKKDFIYASHLNNRQAGLEKALLATDSKAILCLRGGSGSLHLLPRLLKLKKPKKCKLLIGLSDISLLHYFVNQKWNWPSLHAPMLARLGDRCKPVKEKREFIQVVTGKVSLLHYKKLKKINKATGKQQTIKGILVGGNLATLQTTLGTSLSLSGKNKILFFEEIGERAYRIDRMLHHLHLAGVFSGVKAIVLGHFLYHSERSLISSVLSRFFADFKCPVFKGLPCGHGHPTQHTLPLNTPCTLSITSKGQEMFCHTGVQA